MMSGVKKLCRQRADSPCDPKQTITVICSSFRQIQEWRLFRIRTGFPFASTQLTTFQTVFFDIIFCFLLLYSFFLVSSRGNCTINGKFSENLPTNRILLFTPNFSYTANSLKKLDKHQNISDWKRPLPRRQTESARKAAGWTLKNSPRSYQILLLSGFLR